MALTDRKIDGSTPIKNFPKEYNKLIDDLVTEINRLIILSHQRIQRYKI